MKEIYLHVGYHKTGTTAIQVLCSDQREWLLNNDICYPTACCPAIAKHGHHKLAWAHCQNSNYLPTIKGRKINAASEFDNDVQNLMNQIESTSANKIFLSSEEFDILSDNELSNLFSTLSNYKVTPIVVIREHGDFLQSSYQTSVTYSGYSGDFETFKTGQRSRLDYYNYIRQLHDLSGGNIKVLNFSDKKTRNQLIPNVLKVLGINNLGDLSPNALDQRVNESLDINTIEVLRFFNGKIKKFDQIQQILPKLRKIKGPKLTLFNPEEKTHFLNVFSQEINKINHLLPQKEQLLIEEESFTNTEQGPPNLIEAILNIINIAYKENDE